MAFLTGKVYHQIDAKNRIRIPVKFKNAFPKDEQLYFVQFNEGRIAVMPESVLSKRMSLMEEIDPGDWEKMNAMASFLSNTEELSEDTQGRTQLPKSVREYAHLTKDIVTVGMGTFIEIWDQKTYENQIANRSMKDIISTLYKKGNE